MQGVGVGSLPGKNSVEVQHKICQCHALLEKAGRRDLIGYTKHCLIRPVPPRPGETSAGGGHGTGKKGGKAHGGAAGKGPKGSKGHGGMSRAQNTAGRNRAAQGRQGANGGGRRN